jgi:sec-independent protein translocase protein TatA
MFNIGPLELMVILLLALVVVGPSKLPEVGRSIGRALREFRKVQDEVRDSINFNLDAEPVTRIRPRSRARHRRPSSARGPPPRAQRTRPSRRQRPERNRRRRRPRPRRPSRP